MDTDETILKVGHIIKFARAKKNLTMNQLVELTGISKSTIAKTEKGKANPAFVTIHKICKVLDIDMGAFNNFQL